MTTKTPAAVESVIRQHAEQQFAEELAELAKVDDRQRPPNWKLSPWAVRTYLLGGTLANGFERLAQVHRQRAPDRDRRRHAGHRPRPAALGVPGTAKSWVARAPGGGHLRRFHAAGAGHRRHRRGGHPLRLELRAAAGRGAIREALVVSPMMRAMREGKIARIEELTRIPAEVQDTLITILSEKTLPIPELNTEVQARKGFNVIATANNRDKGVNELSSALMRRFNTVVLPRARDAWTRRSRSSTAASRSLAARWSCPPRSPRSKRSAASSRSSASCATA